MIRLRLGDIVPADARLLDGDEIEVDQSALTGESLPATCSAGDAVFSGSIIRRGEIGALVYATGTHTYFGKTAELVQDAHTVSHFQKAVLKIGNYLIIFAVAFVAVIVIASLLRGDPLLTTLQFALVLTVAAIPVAMPTVLSVTMAVGARLLAKQKAIVSKLVAIEELAGVDILCADKTGTLTQNSLTLGDPFSVDERHRGGGDPGGRAGLPRGQRRPDRPCRPRRPERPEGPARLHGHPLRAVQPGRQTHRSHRRPTPTGRRSRSARAPRRSSSPWPATPRRSSPPSTLRSTTSPPAGSGPWAWPAPTTTASGSSWASCRCSTRRARTPPPPSPPRRQMGVTVKMVTGDAIAIAKETAAKVGLGTNILDATGLGDVKKKETTAVVESIETADGFAQVFPEHKYHIVDVLQQRGHIVGMTGDGVNDAPALKKADCGIAVSGATDAARAAAAIVLLTPGLSVIIDAIKESRKIFQRMNSYAMYRIAETLRVLLFVTLAILVFNFFPVTAIMIVMLALLNDGAILSIAYDNVRYKMQPEAWNMRVVLGIATVLGVVGPIAAFGLFYLGDRVFDLGHPRLQTMMYLMLSVAGHLTIFLTRTRGPFWSIRPARILLLAVLGTQAIATLIAVYGLFMHPLGWGWAAFVWGYALIWALASDRIKLLAYRMLDPQNAAGDLEPGPQSGTHDGPGKGAAAVNSAAFYSDTDPRDPVFHDNTDCPYGLEIKNHHNDRPGTDHRRRCEWCADHDQPAAVKSSIVNEWRPTSAPPDLTVVSEMGHDTGRAGRLADPQPTRGSGIMAMPLGYM